MPNRRLRRHRPDLHGHVHEHDGAEHAHPHHHTAVSSADAALHEHAHPLSFERLTYICSPIHSLDPRAKVLSALVLVVGIVVSGPSRPVEYASLVALLLAATLLAKLPLAPLLLRSGLVIPVAATIALFAPVQRAGAPLTPAGFVEAYATHGVFAWAIVSKAWASAYVALLLSAATPPARLLKGLRAMHVPEVFTMLFAFLYRYVDTLKAQLTSMRRAVASRAPGIRGRRLLIVYGSLAGSLFLRSYDRGERIHGAMLSRGYDGSLPSPEPLTLGPGDALMLLTAVLASAALILY